MVGWNTMLELQVDINCALQQDGCCNALEAIIDNTMLLQPKMQLEEVILLIVSTTIVKIDRNNYQAINRPGLDVVELVRTLCLVMASWTS